MDFESCGKAALEALLDGTEWTPQRVTQRVRDLYIVNNTAAWASSRLRILAEMCEDRLDTDHPPLPDLTMEYLSTTLKEIRCGLETVATREDGRS